MNNKTIFEQVITVCVNKIFPEVLNEQDVEIYPYPDNQFEEIDLSE